MDFFDSGGVRIAYEVTGNGPPILLIHGFASNARVNWGGHGLGANLGRFRPSGHHTG